MNERDARRLMDAYGERTKLQQLLKISDPRFWALFAERATPASDPPSGITAAAHPDQMMIDALGDEVSFAQWINEAAHARLNSLIATVEKRIQALGGEL